MFAFYMKNCLKFTIKKILHISNLIILREHIHFKLYIFFCIPLIKNIHIYIKKQKFQKIKTTFEQKIDF